MAKSLINLGSDRCGEFTLPLARMEEVGYLNMEVLYRPSCEIRRIAFTNDKAESFIISFLLCLGNMSSLY